MIQRPKKCVTHIELPLSDKLEAAAQDDKLSVSSYIRKVIVKDLRDRGSLTDAEVLQMATR